MAKQDLIFALLLAGGLVPMAGAVILILFLM